SFPKLSWRKDRVDFHSQGDEIYPVPSSDPLSDPRLWKGKEPCAGAQPPSERTPRGRQHLWGGKSLQSYLRGLESPVGVVAEGRETAIWERLDVATDRSVYLLNLPHTAARKAKS